MQRGHNDEHGDAGVVDWSSEMASSEHKAVWQIGYGTFRVPAKLQGRGEKHMVEHGVGKVMMVEMDGEDSPTRRNRLTKAGGQRWRRWSQSL